MTRMPPSCPRAVAAALLALAIAGCAPIPVDTSVTAQPDFARAQHAATIHLARDGWPEARWWTEYRDPQLDQLMEQALKDSPTLAVTQARVMAARAALRSEQAEGGAKAGLDIGANRQRYSGNGLFPQPIGGNFYNDASVQVRAGYDFDWWGKHRATVAAALGEVNARLAEQSQAEKTLAAALAQSYFRLQALWARLDNLQARLALQRGLVADRAARIRQGLDNIDAQRGAERELGMLGEQAAELGTRAGREREALRALAGADSTALGQLAPRPLPAGAAALPSQLGLELLARRPDLQAARWRVEASLGRVEARRLAFYPDLNLVGAFGLDAISLGKLLRPNSRTMLLGATLELPLFDAGRLGTQLDQARAQRNELIADYNRSVFDAVRDVAEEGVTLQGIEQQVAAHAAPRQASAALLATANTRLAHGLGDRASVLQARLALLAQDDAALQLQDAALQSQVALAKALGGGYRADAVQPDPKLSSNHSRQPDPSHDH